MKNPLFNDIHKGTDFKAQLQKTEKAFLGTPKTMLMVSYQTKIERASICRYVSTLRKQNRITKVETKLCKITGFRAGYYTTNPEQIGGAK